MKKVLLLSILAVAPMSAKSANFERYIIAHLRKTNARVSELEKRTVLNDENIKKVIKRINLDYSHYVHSMKELASAKPK